MQSGPTQFRAWIKRCSMNQAQAAEFFGWHESVISQYLSGARTPNTINAVKIEELAGIPVKAWLLSGDDKQAPRKGRKGRKGQSSQGAISHA